MIRSFVPAVIMVVVAADVFVQPDEEENGSRIIQVGQGCGDAFIAGGKLYDSFPESSCIVCRRFICDVSKFCDLLQFEVKLGPSESAVCK